MTVTARFVDKPDYTKARYRLSLVSEVKDIYGQGSIVEKSVVRTKMKGDALTIIPLEDDAFRKKRLKLNEPIDLNPFQEFGIMSIELNANRYGRNNFLWSLADEEIGTLVLEPKNRLAGAHKGFGIRTVLVNEKGEEVGRGLRVEFN